jgi:hypothetical protein
MIQLKNNSESVTRLRANSEGPNLETTLRHCVDHTDVAALAELYNAPPASHFDREELLQQARTALMKYELAEDELAIATNSLAHCMHMLLDQHGLKRMEPKQMLELEQDVLNWCGLRYPGVPLKNRSVEKVAQEVANLVGKGLGSAKQIPLATVPIRTQLNI